MYYRSIQVFRVELECNVCDTLTELYSVHSVSLNVSQLFFTPDVGTWLHVELCQTDRSVSVLLTTKVMTVYCIGTVRKKQFSFF